MVAHDAVLDKPLLRKIIASGHSRIPVHRPGKPCAPGWTARPSRCKKQERARLHEMQKGTLRQVVQASVADLARERVGACRTHNITCSAQQPAGVQTPGIAAALCTRDTARPACAAPQQ